ncbi:hypothetical protein BC941DRAFT_446416 [Chlamydoabsidia padenii]|nr:hypothetical protein BC941DRAFT_446416 [Chlamydoabsidia padenii]
MESQPSFDLTSFLKEVTEHQSLPVSMVTWHQAYLDKVGLSDNASANEDGHVIPLHPKALELELERYKETIEDLKTKYIELDTKSRFLSIVLEDPPRQIEPKERIELEGTVFTLSQRLADLQEELVKSKQTIAEINANTEKDRQELNKVTDSITKITDEIEAQNRQLAELEAKIKQGLVKRTPEETKALLDECTLKLAEISKTKDACDDRVAELEWQIDDELQEVQALETTLRKAQAIAQEAVEKSGERDPSAEQQEAWCTQMTKLCYSIHGIEKLSIDICFIKVDYSTNDQLVITLDPLTGIITDVSVNNENVAIGDLLDLGKGHLVKDVVPTIILEILARTRSK